MLSDLSVWQKNGTNKIYYNTGNVGIGTNEPEQKLDVNGRLQVRGTAIYFGIDNDGSTNRAMVYKDWGLVEGKDKLIINYNDWQGNGSDYSNGVIINGKIQMTSNVGIGTTPKTGYRCRRNEC